MKRQVCTTHRSVQPKDQSSVMPTHHRAQEHRHTFPDDVTSYGILCREVELGLRVGGRETADDDNSIPGIRFEISPGIGLPILLDGQAKTI